MFTVRGHCSIEVKQIGSDWLGVARARWWNGHLVGEAWETAGDLDYWTEYKLLILKFSIAFHLPGKLVNLIARLARRTPSPSLEDAS